MDHFDQFWLALCHHSRPPQTDQLDKAVVVVSDEEAEDVVGGREALLSLSFDVLKVLEADGCHFSEVLPQPRLVLQPLLLHRNHLLKPVGGGGGCCL